MAEEVHVHVRRRYWASKKKEIKSTFGHVHTHRTHPNLSHITAHVHHCGQSAGKEKTLLYENWFMTDIM